MTLAVTYAATIVVSPPVSQDFTTIPDQRVNANTVDN